MTNWNYTDDVMGSSSIRQQLELNTDLSDFTSHMIATDTKAQPGSAPSLGQALHPHWGRHVLAIHTCRKYYCATTAAHTGFTVVQPTNTARPDTHVRRAQIYR